MRFIQNSIFVAASIAIVACVYADEGDLEMWSNRLFPDGSPPAEVVDVVDIRSASADTKLAAFTLQGQINRKPKAKAYLLSGESDVFWLDWMKEKGYIHDTRRLSLSQYFHEYRDTYRSVVVYDPELPATINIATMVASLDDGIVIAPADLKKHGNEKTVVDLRGRWKTNVEAYRWALSNLWERMNHSLLACFHPNYIPHNLRDYLIRNQVFTFWITGREEEDGVKSSFSSERQFAEELFSLSPVNIPVIGFWGSGGDAGITEYEGVGLAGQYGKLTVPCDWTTNLSFLSGIPVDFEKLVAEYKKLPTPQEHTLENDKVYISFDIVESGDAPVYWQNVQRTVWQDSGRGKIPIGWSLGPSAIELIPPIMAWFYEKATWNDDFIMGISGACYVHPYRDFMAKVADPESAWKDYLRLTQHYMDILDLRDIYLYTDAWKPFERGVRDPVTMRFAHGLENLDSLILGMGRDEGITRTSPNYFTEQSDVLVSHIFTRWDTNNVKHIPENRKWLIDEIRKNTPTKRPAFMHIHALSWGYHPSDLLAVLEELGNEYVAVSAADFRRLYRGTL